MKFIFSLLSWIFGCLFLLLFLLSLYSRHVLPSLFVLLISVLLIPPIRKWLSELIHLPLPVWLRSILIPVLFFLFVFLIFKGMGNKYSIYKNPDIGKKLMAIYDNRMNQWPVSYKDRYIDTQYGKVYVIISGPEDAPPVFLLHASAMGSWSWLYNIQGLNEHYRTYAVDTIGDAGKSVLKDINTFPTDGKALADLYTGILDSLGVDKACFMGASQGGFITTNMALYAPDRVEKIILCGPMGYTGTNASVLRILFTTMFPVKPVQDSATRWAFGDDPRINAEVGDWFGLILQGVISRQARPQPFTREQLGSFKLPVLLLLGSRDGLVGNPENGKQLVKDLANFRVEILDTGHLISAERPDEFNKLVINFIGKPENNL